MTGARACAAVAVLVMAAAGLAACSDDGDAEAAPGTTAPIEVGSPGCDGGDGIAGPHELVHDGIAREYVVHLPDGDDNETPAPLLYNFHGLGGNVAQQDDMSGLPEAAGARGVIVVTPQGEPLGVADLPALPFWNVFVVGVDTGGEEVAGVIDPESSEIGADDVGFVRELTAVLLDEYCVDEERVLATGMSNGAGMSSVLACELDGAIAAIAPVTGSNIVGECSGDAPVSVLALHGDADDVVAYDGNFLVGLALGNPSVPDRLAAWGGHNGCEAEPVVEDDGEGVVVTRWERCTDGVEVELWTLQGWGHRWPRGADAVGPGSIDATELILDFFDRVTDR